MRTAFVTGATGQDGGFLIERLLAEGMRVHGLVRGGDGEAAQLRLRSPEVVLHEGDLADAGALSALIRELAPDEIYNLGGISSVAFSWEQPLLTSEITGLGAAALLEAAWQLRQATGQDVRFLQASSAEIFGLPLESPQSESTPVRPVSPYGAAKAFAHHLVAVYRSRGLHAVSAILFNHESPRRPTTFVTRKITHAAAMIAAGRQDTLQLGSLDVRRDWGWAPEYVDAMVRGLRHDVPDDYVVATGVSHSIAEFVETAFAYAGLADWRRFVTIDPAFARVVDATEMVGDPSHAGSVLGWRPRTTFQQLVEQMVQADMTVLMGSS